MGVGGSLGGSLAPAEGRRTRKLTLRPMLSTGSRAARIWALETETEIGREIDE